MHHSKKAIAKEPHEKGYPVKNSVYMLRLLWKSAPQKITLQFSSQLFNIVYYDVVYSIYFLKSTLSVIENGGPFSDFVKVIAIIGIVKISNEFLYYWFFQNKNEQLNVRVYRELNSMLFKKAVSTELACFENTKFYDKYKRARDVAQSTVFREFTGNVSYIIGGIVSISIISAYIVSIDPWIMLVGVLALVNLLLKQLSGKLEYRKDKEMTPYQREKDYIKRTVFLKDYAKEMKTSGVAAVLNRRFENAVKSNIAIIRKYGIKSALLENAIEFFSGILPTVGGYAYASWRFVVRGDLAISDFAVLIAAIMRFKSSLQWVGETFSDIYKNCLYIQNFREYMEYEPKIVSGDKEVSELETLEFRGVSFSYEEDGESLVLKNVSFKINKGERIAIVGHNGAGKTTLSKLLMRFYDVDEGEIFVNGINIKEYDLEQYRRLFACVFQDYRLFSLTVAENVLMRECDSDEDYEKVKAALIKSGVYDKVESLENGVDTLLTKEFDDEGAVLSGGESQKVAIARLFAGEFSLALLDEPSSALDPIAESKMYDCLVEATRGKTVMYISHRLSSAVESDRVFVFENGSLIEEGSHAELMKLGKKYNEMFNLQAVSYRSEKEAAV